MNTIAAIKFCFENQPLGKLFTTSEFLRLGTRAAVDQSLYRLVKIGVIVRLARGVFTKNNSHFEHPGILPIALAKAAAFSKRIITSGSNAVRELNLVPWDRTKKMQDSERVIYNTDGPTSSFWCGTKKIVFKRISNRQMQLGESKSGLSIRALWCIGRGSCTAEQATHAAWVLNRTHRTEFKRSAALMPKWIREFYGWDWLRET